MTTISEDEMNNPNLQLAVFPNGGAFDLFDQVRKAPVHLLEEVDACTDIPNPHPCHKPLLLACLLIRIIADAPLDGRHFTVDNLR